MQLWKSCGRVRLESVFRSEKRVSFERLTQARRPGRRRQAARYKYNQRLAGRASDGLVMSLDGSSRAYQIDCPAFAV